MPCDYCGYEFDPIASRWLCPACHQKSSCCDGAPLPACDERSVVFSGLVLMGPQVADSADGESQSESRQPDDREPQQGFEQEPDHDERHPQD